MVRPDKLQLRLIQTLKSIVALSEFFIREEVLKFIFVGKLTLDPIVGRFS